MVAKGNIAKGSSSYNPTKENERGRKIYYVEY
jgi:hypothetical protein